MKAQLREELLSDTQQSQSPRARVGPHKAEHKAEL